MDIRNAKYNAFGTIDCEVDHPVYGWIPFTADPDDVEPLGAEVFNAAQSSAAAYIAPVIDPAQLLADERATMVCTPMQGILTLGELEWAKVIEYRDTTATWQEKIIIDSALDWKRNSQNIAFFQFLLGYTDEQVDDLFRTAMAVEA